MGMPGCCPQFLRDVGRKRGDHQQQWFGERAGDGAVARNEPACVSVQLDKTSNRCVKSQLREVLVDASDRLVQPPRRFLTKWTVVHPGLTRLLVDNVAPKALQEPVSTHNVVGAPRSVHVE